MSKVSDSNLKNKLLLVLLVVVIFRLGSFIPVPGLDPEKLFNLFNQKNSLIGIFNTFTGGALSRFSIFAIGIAPYISSSIMIQLLSTVVPHLEQLKKEGGNGRKKITQYTRYLTILMATFQGFGLTKFLVSNNIALEPSFIFYFTTILTLISGTMFLVWLGEIISEKGIGNGVSIIIFTGIVAGMPSIFSKLFSLFSNGQIKLITLISLLLLTILIISFVTFVERAQRKILITYAQRTQGKKVFSAQKSHLPLKINMAGVIPPIFSSMLLISSMQLLQWASTYSELARDLSLQLAPGKTLYFVFFAILIIFFAFFYTSTVTSPKEMSENLKKSSAVIPGIRPGLQTTTYIDDVMSRLTLIGSFYIAAVCVFPDIVTYTYQIPFLGGTSILIAVVVVIDFMLQVQSSIMSQQYDSLMRKSGLKTSKKSRKRG